MSKIKITQVKSHIDRPQRQKDTILALGLGKINKSKVVENNPQIQGMINAVAHLVTVENINS
jgi:large subunit ribosomal protein L30